MSRKRRTEKGLHVVATQRVAPIPSPGAVLRPDGTWLEPTATGGYLLRQGGHGEAHAAALRRRMRGSLAERFHVALSILDSEDTSNRDRLQALEFLARYGLGQRMDRIDADLVKALALAVQAEVQEPAILKRIERRWADVLKEHVTGNKPLE